MEGVSRALNVFEDYIQVFDSSRGSPRPLTGIAEPKTRRACDVVRYLWEEAQNDENQAVARTIAEYTDDCVFEDMGYADDLWPRSKEDLRKFEQENQDRAPKDLRFVLDEVSDGTQACAVSWHVEWLGRMTPRGVSFYSLSPEGKVSYARSSYD